MSQIILNEQAAAPSTPSANKASLFVDTAGILLTRDDAGKLYGYSSNAATAAQGAGFANETYVTNSGILVPSSVGALNLQVKSRFLWRISASKSGASTATPIYTVRVGANQSTGDTSIWTATGPAQTAIADIATLYVMLTLRTIGTGTSAVLQGTAWWEHRGTGANTTTSGTGFANDSTGHVEATGTGFDSSGRAGQFIGLTINGGLSASWTLTQAWAEAWW